MNATERRSAARGLRSVATFVLPALAGVIVVAAVIAWKQELFVSRTPIFVFTDSALGITKGIPVKVFGLTVGTVDDIEIVPGAPGVKGQVRVRLNIGSEYLQHITRDSKAKLMREAVVGQSLIEIVPGELHSRPVGRNEVIAFERGKTLGELSEELNRSLSPVLAQMKEAFRDVQSPEGRVQKTVERMATLIDELPESNRRLQSLLATAERTVTRADAAIGNADKAALKAEGALGDIGKLVTEVSAAAPAILKNIDAAAQGMARSAEAVQRITDGAAKRMPVLIEGSDSLIRDAGQVMTGARGSWPVRLWVEPAVVTTLNIDSGEASH